MLPDCLFALERFLVLFEGNELLIFHVLQLVLKIAKLSLFILELARGCFHIVLKLLLLILSYGKLVFKGYFESFGFLKA